MTDEPPRLASPFPRFVPEPRLAVIIAVLSVLWLVPGPVGSEIAAAALGLALIAALVDALTLPGAHDVLVERIAPPTVGIGDRHDIEYVLTSHWARSLRARLADDLPAAVTGGVIEHDVDVPAGGRAMLTAPLSGAIRGRFGLGPIGLRVRTRVGLIARRVRWEAHDTVLVTPSIAGVHRFRLLALQHRLYEAGIRTLRQRGEGRSFASLREYVIGDDPRHIDWKATARRGKTITREFTVEQSQSVFCLIDAGRSMTQLAGAYSRFEYALSSALPRCEKSKRRCVVRFDECGLNRDEGAPHHAQRGPAALRRHEGAHFIIEDEHADAITGAGRYIREHERCR